MGLRYKKAKCIPSYPRSQPHGPIIFVKKNPQSRLFTDLAVLTRGTVIEVNVQELGITTASGKVVWG